MGDTSSFSFIVCPSIENKHGGYGLKDLHTFDVKIVNQVKSKVRNRTPLSLNFVVEKDNIALSQSRTGFVEFTLCLSSLGSAGDGEVSTLSTGVMQFHFGENSQKVKSMKHVITKSFILTPDNHTSGENY